MRKAPRSTEILAFLVVVTACNDNGGDRVESSSTRAQTTPISVAAEQSTLAPRENWAAFAQDPAKLSAFRRGVSEMKSRKPSNPKSWFYQAAVHGVTDEAVAEAQALDPDVASVDQAHFWNQCPHDGQGSANFLIWHRAYLHHFEQILRDASGDETLSLPYWDYTDPNHRTFPSEFAPEFLDEAETQQNPLHKPDRELAFVFGLHELTDRAADDGPARSASSFFGDIELEGFAGADNDTDSQTKAPIERVPHDMLHVAIGGLIGAGPGNEPATGAMAFVPTAAFDPIFWIHHSNIDRIWDEWDCTPGKNWGPLPSRNWLNVTPWEFNTFDGTVVSLSRLDYIRLPHTVLSFADPATRCDAPLSETEPPDPETPVFGVNVFQSQLATILDEAAGPFRVSAGDRLSVPLSRLNSVEAPGFETVFMATTDFRRTRVLIELANMRLSSIPSVGFDVYISSSNNPEKSEFVGSVGLFGMPIEGAQLGHHAHEGNQLFDVTRAIAALGSDADVVVEVIPFELLQPVGDEALIVREGALLFDQVTVKFVQLQDR